MQAANGMTARTVSDIISIFVFIRTFLDFLYFGNFSLLIHCIAQLLLEGTWELDSRAKIGIPFPHVIRGRFMKYTLKITLSATTIYN
jgi:hypothetical protein